MGDNTPTIIDLSKQTGDDETDTPDTPSEAAADTYPDDVGDGDGDNTPDSASEAAAENYPDDVGDGDDDDTPDTPSEAAAADYAAEGSDGPASKDDEQDGDDTDAAEGVEPHGGRGRDDDGVDDYHDKELSLDGYDLTHKFDGEAGFDDVTEGDTVVIDTPLHGGKTGEVTGIEEAWTGTLHLSVDTGGNQYEISPYDDEFSQQFVARIEESDSLSPDLLQHLGKTDMIDVDVGEQVMLDVPHVGPAHGVVSYKGQTETQGTQVDVTCGPVTFKLFENQTPGQKKESPVLIGRVQ